MQLVVGSIPTSGTISGVYMGKELTGFFREALDRGYVHQFTSDLVVINDLFETPQTAYVGYDCTADSLHVGNLATIMMLRLFQKHGHKPLVLLGTATSRIGDPSGKDETRTMLSDKQISKNAASLSPVFTRFLAAQTPLQDFEFVENGDWYSSSNIEFLEFLCEIGPHVSVNQMLAQDSIKNRLTRNSPLSFLEFSYMVIQAYDFVLLAGRKKCMIQMGGSDQWGNIVAGIELGRKMRGLSLYGLTTPLITTAAGEKMGKSAGNAIWLNADKTSPYEYWQFWRNTADADVFRFLKLFTDLDVGIINDYERMLFQKDDKPNYVDLMTTFKVILANYATALCHGKDAADAAAATAKEVFENHGSAGLPVVEVPVENPLWGIRLDALFVKVGLASSLGAARRLAEGGGAYMDDQVILPALMQKTQISVPDGVAEVKLSSGKKRHVIARLKVMGLESDGKTSP